MNILHGYLKSIKAASFCDLDFLTEAFDKILVDDAIGCSEKGEDMRDEMTLTILEFCPVVEIF